GRRPLASRDRACRRPLRQRLQHRRPGHLPPRRHDQPRHLHVGPVLTAVRDVWQGAHVLDRLRARPEWKFFGVLFEASPPLATAWWVLLVLRASMPALLAVATGVLIAAVENNSALTGPLTFVGIVFVALQVLTPVQQAVSAHIGAVASD